MNGAVLFAVVDDIFVRVFLSGRTFAFSLNEPSKCEESGAPMLFGDFCTGDTGSPAFEPVEQFVSSFRIRLANTRVVAYWTNSVW